MRKASRAGYKCGACRGFVESVKPVPPEGLSLVYTEPHGGVEKFYYQMLDELRERDFAVEKIRDVYTASEASDLWGELERRKQFQAEQAMKYMASIGSMMKSLFQMIRELRLIDERLTHYEGRKKGQTEDDIALKGIWIDKVEGGAQKPSSVYGMATQLGFTTLPDLFFNTCPKEKKDIGKIVDSLKSEGVNKKVREVLQRKLAEFMTWLENTEKELKTGRRFKLMYLRQHFHVIRMYLDWVRPYIKNVSRLNILSQGGKADARTKADLIRASETAVMDIEIIGVRKGGYFKPCVRVVFHFQTRPSLEFRKEYQRGPIHVGKTIMDIEGYALSDSDLKAYRDTKIDEDIEVLKSVFASIEALEEELLRYLKEADDAYSQEKLGKKEKKDGKTPSFIARVFKREKKEKIPSKYEREKLRKVVEGGLYDVGSLTGFTSGVTWKVFDKMKKFFGSLRW